MSEISFIKGALFMPRTKEQNEKIRRATKEKIQSAAMRLFARKGLASTGVQDIADEAGISIGLLYRHCRAKEDLFYELVEFAIEGLEAITQKFQTEASPRELMEGLAAEICEDLKSNEDFVNMLILMVQAFLSGEDGGRVQAIIDKDLSVYSATVEVIRRGQELGEFGEGDPTEMAVFFYSAVQGLGVMRAATGPGTPTPSPGILTAHLYRRKDGH
jgi:AcrR family transcriptional regulator